MNPTTAISALSAISLIEPLVVPIVADIRALLTKHPTMTPDQLAALVQQLATVIHATNADTLSVIAADQAAHPTA